MDLLPCGRCVECRERYRKDVCNRSIIEAANSGTVYFFTLTYEDKYLPKYGLEKSHVQQFFKRLRTIIARYFSDTLNISFTTVYCGEYGLDPTKTLRPHYHGIIYIAEHLTPQQRLLFADLFKPRKSDYPADFPEYLKDSSCFYDKHPDVSRAWPYGLIFDLDECRNSFALSNYVTKYIIKSLLYIEDESIRLKFEAKNGHYNSFFFQMPKSIGLGCKYLDLYRDQIINNPDSYLSVKDIKTGQVQNVGIPLIFINKIFPNISSFAPRYTLLISVYDLLLSFLEYRVENTYRDSFWFNECLNLRSWFQDYAEYLVFRKTRRLKREIDLYAAFYSKSTCQELFDILITIQDHLVDLWSYNQYLTYLDSYHDFIEFKTKNSPNYIYINYIKERCLAQTINYVEKYMLES